MVRLITLSIMFLLILLIGVAYAADEQALLSAHNQLRAAAGKPPVCLNAKLISAATKHCKDMLANGYFSHYGRDGSNPGTRMSREGYQFTNWGENIAWGYTTVNDVMQGWKGSSGHYRNIIGSFKEIGATRCGSGYNKIWVVDFGTPRGATQCTSTIPNPTPVPTTCTPPCQCVCPK